MKRLTILVILMSAGSAWAHPGHGAGGFPNGLIHPLLGLDHWLAMLGLGLWSYAARLPRKALATVCSGRRDLHEHGLDRPGLAGGS
jgi:hydrogenase/urease accessory protein HupE